MFGYNDMNTNVPNPFATQGNIVLSGAGRKNLTRIDTKMWDDERPKLPIKKSFKYEMDGAGWMDDINKGYNKTKSVVKSETGQKI